MFTSITKQLLAAKMAECNEIMSNIKQMMKMKGAVQLLKKN